MFAGADVDVLMRSVVTPGSPRPVSVTLAQ